MLLLASLLLLCLLGLLLLCHINIFCLSGKFDPHITQSCEHAITISLLHSLAHTPQTTLSNVDNFSLDFLMARQKIFKISFRNSRAGYFCEAQCGGRVRARKELRFKNLSVLKYLLHGETTVSPAPFVTLELTSSSNQRGYCVDM